jgi:hypothetical protein
MPKGILSNIHVQHLRLSIASNIWFQSILRYIHHIIATAINTGRPILTILLMIRFTALAKHVQL